MIEPVVADFAFMTEVERYNLFLKLYRSEDAADQTRLAALMGDSDPMTPLILLRYFEEIPEKKSCQAVLQLLQGENDIVAKAAMGAYQRIHYPGKPRLLKQLIFSKNFTPFRFAVRTLSRAGFMEALPLILGEIEEREGRFLLELIVATRYLPHRRSIAVLLPLAEAKEEPVRYRCMEALAELQGRTRGVPVAALLQRLEDPSDRVRAAALEALERFPTRRIAPLIFSVVDDATRAPAVRVRAIRALSSFADEASAQKAAQAVAFSNSPELRLAAEITLRRFPRAVVRKALLPMLSDNDLRVRRQAAIFLAEFCAQDAAVRRALFAAWSRGDSDEALEFVEPLQILGGADTIGILKEAAAGDAVLSYAAATALARMRGEVPGRDILEMIDDPKTSSLVRQALLDRWAKRGPDRELQPVILRRMLETLDDSVPNNRYLAVQVLSWFPLESCLVRTLDLLSNEPVRDIRLYVLSSIADRLKEDPTPLLRAVQLHRDCLKLVVPLVDVLLRRSWPGADAGELLDALREPPLELHLTHPQRYAAIAAHFLRYGALTLQDAWMRFPGQAALIDFLKFLRNAGENRRFPFPGLPASFLELQAAAVGPEFRVILYDLMAQQGLKDGGEFLAASLMREREPECLRRGSDLMRVLWAGPRK